MSVARIVLRTGYKDIQYQPLPKEIEDADDVESPVSVGGCNLDIATTPTSSGHEQQRLLTDDGEANIPLQTDDPEFNELIVEVCVLYILKIRAHDHILIHPSGGFLMITLLSQNSHV